MKRIIFLGCFMLFMQGTLHAESFDHQHALWTRILQQHVKVAGNPSITTVDYASLKSEPENLRQYLKQLSSVSTTEFHAWPEQHQLAFLINAYNAFTIKLILDHYPVASIRDIGSLWESAWKIPFIPLLGSNRSLDDIEHGMIRGDSGYHEPRIHFAVNCASVGCPALRPEAYTADKLDQQLEASTRLFLSDKARNRFEAGTYYLSSIFKWYRKDFEQGWNGINSLEQFLSLYAHDINKLNTDKNVVNTARVTIKYLDYDWRLNQTSRNIRGEQDERD